MAEVAEREDVSELRIKVIGVGGAGSNIVDRLRLSSLPHVRLAIANTDQQALAASPVDERHCIGRILLGGLGAGGDAEVGREAAQADRLLLEAMVKDVDLLFVTVGLGGGTGTGIAPVLAEVAARQGATVIAFATLPFSIERAMRANVAKHGLAELREVANAVIPLPNDLLIQESHEDASLRDAFSQADAWVERAVRSICSMMHETGMINLDFSQLRQMFACRAGKTLFGLGSGSGPAAAEEAVASLKLCPLLHAPEFSKSADHLLVNIAGGPSMKLSDTKSIMESVAEEFGLDANIVMGAVIDEALSDSIELCIIGTSDLSDTLTPSSRALRRAKAALAPPEKEESAAPPRRVKVEQEEFAFNETDPKGEFEKYSGTLFEGQDLDTPTFLRKGIKIPL